MKVVLVSTDETRSVIGARTLSSCLAENGFSPVIVTMATPGERFHKVRWEDLREICRDARLIGISCMTHGVDKAIETKNRLRKWTYSPIVIGGIHATMAPESLTGEFDLIGHGEGEDLIVTLAERIQDGVPYHDIPGLWLRHEPDWIRNPALPLRRDINDYPLPNYDLTRQYILEDSRIVPMNRCHIERDFFVVLGSRGCPHHCTYCCNQSIKEQFPWRKRVRHYTTDHLIRHLRTAGEMFPEVRSFWIDDDTFFAKGMEEIAEFSRLYKSEIGKPFLVLISPWTFDEEKLRGLIDCGLSRLIMGIQSGSDHTTRTIYDRNLSSDKILAIARTLHRYSDRMQVCYDFIGMNPFESADDLIRTIVFIRSLPPPFFIFCNNLAFYPGTRLHSRAVEAGHDVTGRIQHTDVEIGYKILIRERIPQKFLHLLLLRMQHDTPGWRIGRIPRFLLTDGWLSLYRFLDHRFAPQLNAMTAVAAWGLLYLNWRRIVKSAIGPSRAARLYAWFLNLRDRGSSPSN